MCASPMLATFQHLLEELHSEGRILEQVDGFGPSLPCLCLQQVLSGGVETEWILAILLPTQKWHLTDAQSGENPGGCAKKMGTQKKKNWVAPGSPAPRLESLNKSFASKQPACSM